MLDAQLRAALAPPLNATATHLSRAGVSPLAVTATGWLAGVGACVAAGSRHWPLALALWLGNRLLDGLDGPLARRRGATDVGGFLDIVADFSVYAGFVVAVAVAVPAARLAAVALLSAYYVSGAAFLALSSLAERRRATMGDNRSLRFVGGLAEGAETVVAYAAFCLLPSAATEIAWGFTAAVAITAGQRLWWGTRLLSTPVESMPPHPDEAATAATGVLETR